MSAYYNENDPFAAAWLRELIAGGHIAPGDVDEGSIEDVLPADFVGYSQCHFFAGIGGWSRALRLAGWPDDRPVWTGSCPCQPFSAAGKRGGTADERHLWPAFHHLIRARRPAVVFGEQVASPDGLQWWQLVHDDLQAAAYLPWACGLGAASAGAPHIRQRLWWVADTSSAGFTQFSGERHQSPRPPTSGTLSGLGDGAGRGCGKRGDAPCSRQGGHADGAGDPFGGLADGDGRHPGAEGLQRSGQYGLVAGDGSAGGGLGDTKSVRRQSGPPWLGFDGARVESRGGEPVIFATRSEDAGVGLGHRLGAGLERHAGDGDRTGRRAFAAGPAPEAGGADGFDGGECTGPLHSFWQDADWLFCRDGRWRPVEPGTFPLAHGVPARVGRLRGYGNAIVPQVAAEMIGAYMESC